MTRGRLVVIFKEEAYVSIEFNGDMYYEEGSGYGVEAIHALFAVRNKNTFETAVKMFDEENFGYASKYGVNLVKKISFEDALDFREENYKRKTYGYSDYIYIRNLSGQDVVARNEDGEHVIANGLVGVFFYGKFQESLASADWTDNQYAIALADKNVEDYCEDNCEEGFKEMKYTFFAEPGDVFYSYIGSMPYKVGLYEVQSIIVDTDGIKYRCGQYILEKKEFQGKEYVNARFLWTHDYSDDCFKMNMWHNYADALRMLKKSKKGAVDYKKSNYEDDCIEKEEIEKYNFKPRDEFHKDIDRVMLYAELLSVAVMSIKQGLKPSASAIVAEIIPELNEGKESYYDMCFDSNGTLREEFRILINEKLIKYLANKFDLYEGDARRLVAYTRYCYIRLKSGDMFHLKNKPLPGRIVFWES